MTGFTRARYAILAVAVLTAMAILSIAAAPGPARAANENPASGFGGRAKPVTVDLRALAGQSSTAALPSEPVAVGRLTGEDEHRRLKLVAAAASPASANATTTSALDAAFEGDGYSSAAPAPPTIASFPGPSYTGSIPPDAALAAGPTQLVAAVNSSFSVYNKAGGLLIAPVPFSVLAAPLGLAPTHNYFDPRATFDPASGRFFLLFAGRERSLQSSYLILAVSATGDAIGPWRVYGLNGATNNGAPTDTWADYPSLGVDSTAVYLTANMFDWNGAYRYAKLRILAKSPLLSGSVAPWHDEWDLRDADGFPAFTLQAAVNGGGQGVAYLLNSGWDGSGAGRSLTLWSVTDPLSASPRIARATINVSQYDFPPDANQPGSTRLLDTGDPRLLAVVYRNGSLWASQTVARSQGGPSVAAIRFYEIQAATGAVRQDGTFGAAGVHHFYPAVMVDNTNDAMLVFNRSSATEYASARYTGRLAGDGLGTLRESVSLKAGTVPYEKLDSVDRNRWGDYSAIALEPDGRTFWMLGEYAAFDSAWGQNTWAMWMGSTIIQPNFTFSRTLPVVMKR